MVVGYEVFEDGTLQQIELTKDGLDSAKVLCVVDDATKSIYLWKGSQAGIRSKFIGARVATNLRTEYGFHFKVRPIDEGSEPPTFFSAVEGLTTATPVVKPGQAAPPPRPPAPATAQTTRAMPPEETVSSPPPPPPVRPKAPEVQAEPVRTAPTRTAPPSIPQTAPARTVVAPTPSSGAQISPDIMSMIHELESSEPPEGYHRELLIVLNQLFTVAEHKVKVFGQEKVERRFERVKEPPEGTFMAEGFIPRVIVKDGTVLGIELLKGTPDAILSPIKTEMRERLTDLIGFFKSELEEAPTTAGGTKKPVKRKLVAK